MIPGYDKAAVQKSYGEGPQPLANVKNILVRGHVCFPELPQRHRKNIGFPPLNLKRLSWKPSYQPPKPEYKQEAPSASCLYSPCSKGRNLTA